MSATVKKQKEENGLKIENDLIGYSWVTTLHLYFIPGSPAGIPHAGQEPLEHIFNKGQDVKGQASVWNAAYKVNSCIITINKNANSCSIIL